MIDFGYNLLVNPSATNGLTGWTAMNVTQEINGCTGYCFRFDTIAYLKQNINLDTSITNIFYISCYFKPQTVVNISQVQAYIKVTVFYSDNTKDIFYIICTTTNSNWLMFGESITVNDKKTIVNASFEVITNGISGYFDDLFISEDYRTLDTPIWAHDSTITVIGVTETTIKISWTPAFGRNPLKIYRINYGEYIDISANVTTATITGLQPKTEYTISLAVVDINNKSNENGPTIKVTTLPDTQAPTWPPSAQIIVEGASENTLSIAWTAANDNVAVTQYRIYCNDIQVGTTSETTFTISNLNSDVAYKIAVDAGDAAGNFSSKIQTTGKTIKSYQVGSGVLELEALGGCINPKVIIPIYVFFTKLQ
jgi:chitodextrinase